MVFSSGCSARTARSSPSASSARITVAEIGASSVTERVTEFRLAKRTRTVTVRPGLDLAGAGCRFGLQGEAGWVQKFALRRVSCQAPTAPLPSEPGGEAGLSV